MGFNTTVFVLNDGLDQLQKNPQQFVDRLCQAIYSSKEEDVAVGYHCNVVKVMKTAHADVPRLYFTYGNSITDIGTWPQFRKDMSPRNKEYLKECIKKAKRMIKEVEQELKREEEVKV